METMVDTAMETTTEPAHLPAHACPLLHVPAPAVAPVALFVCMTMPTLQVSVWLADLSDLYGQRPVLCALDLFDGYGTVDFLFLGGAKV